MTRFRSVLSFRSVLWPPFSTSSLIIYNTVGQIYQNSLKFRLNSPGWEKMTTLNVQEYLQTLYWLFRQTKHGLISSIYRNKPIVTYTYMYWALMKREALLTISRRRDSNLQYNNFFKLSVLSRDPRKSVTRGGKLWSPETLLYPNIFHHFFAVLSKSC